MKWKIHVFAWAIVLIFPFCSYGWFGVSKAKSEYDLGLETYQEEKYEESLVHLKKALEIDPEYSPAKDLIPWLHFKLNRIEAAEAYFAKAADENPNDINAVQGMAWIYAVKGDYDKAEEMFKQQLQLAERHTNDEYFPRYKASDRKYLLSIRSDANYGMGNIAQKRGDIAGAIEFFKKAMWAPNQFVREETIALSLADLYLAQKDYKETGRTLEKAVKATKKKDVNLLNKTGWVYFAAGEYDEAGKFFSASLKERKDDSESLYGMAVSLYKQEKFKDARAYLKKAIEKNPYYVDVDFVHAMIREKSDYRELWKDFGMAYYSLGDYPAARFKFSIYNAIDPNDYDVRMASGWSNRWAGFIAEAKTDFDKSLTLKPGNTEPIVGRGSTFLASGKYPEAEQEFKKALSIKPQDAGAFNGLGHLYLITGDRGKARNNFLSAIKADAKHFDSLAQMAALSFQEKDYSGASAYYRKLIDLNPLLIAPHNSLGWCLYYLGKHTEAEKEFGRSKELNPYLADCYYGLGLTYYAQGRKDEAKNSFATAIQIAPLYAHTAKLEELISANPDWKSLYLTLGWSYYRFRNYTGALKAFEISGKSQEPEWDPLRGRAWSHYWLGQYDSAYPLFKQLTDSDETDADASVGIGWVLFNQRKYNESMAVMKRIVEKNSRLTQCWRTIAAVHYVNGDLEKARETYNKVKGMEPKATDVFNNTGWSYYKQRNYREAINAFQQSIQIAPGFGEPHYGLGLSYYRTGKVDEARKELLSAIYLYPAFMDSQDFYDILDSNPDLVTLTNDMGWSYFYMQYYQAALFHFDRMLKKQSEFIDAILGKGATLYVLGDWDGAIESYSQLSGKVPASGKFWDKWSNMINNLGWCYYYKGNYQKALSAFKDLDQYHRNLNFIAPLNGVGWCYLKLNDKAKAKEAFTRSLEILPGNYLAESGLAFMPE